jgi:asparagine synthase (glutamine-hydrolysing)
MDFFPRRLRINHLADRLPKLSEIMAHQDGVSFYRALISSQVKQPDQLVLGSKDADTIFSLPERLPNLPSLRERMMYLDMMSYLPDDILTKVDRASMAVGLEVRIPMLDHRLVEFAWRVPTILKHRDGQGKWILRQVLNRYVPNKLINRPKMGFGLPIEHWLRGPLRGWAESLLNDKRLRDEGFFDPELIRKIWQEHLTGQRRWHSFLWTVLMFQAWYAEQKNTP